MNRRIVTVVASLLLVLAGLMGAWLASPAVPSAGQQAACSAIECSAPLSGSLIEDLRHSTLMSDGPAQFGTIDMLDAPAWLPPASPKAEGDVPLAPPHARHAAPFLGRLLRPPEIARA